MPLISHTFASCGGTVRGRIHHSHHLIFFDKTINFVCLVFRLGLQNLALCKKGDAAKEEEIVFLQVLYCTVTMNPNSMVSFPMDVGAHNGFMNNNVFMNPQQVTSFIPNACRRCHHGGCDVKVMDCGCLFHAVSQSQSVSALLCVTDNVVTVKKSSTIESIDHNRKNLKIRRWMVLYFLYDFLL